ncbi:MAG: hypothetical protein OEY49_07590 [Candidatus Heimdallarchaeota archaeon]|nr:hypothetical protein [Candidatus Heimdallarchaeota archaeon]
MESSNTPKTRKDWAILSWNEAQSEVGLLLKQQLFVRFDEYKLGNKRADIIAYKIFDNKILFGIIEVKTFKKISPSIENKAMEQACNYLSKYFDIVENNSKWGNKAKIYFVATIFTNDYPASFSDIYQNKYTKLIPKILVDEERVYLISCRPRELIPNLRRLKLLNYDQNKLDKFF